jgi:hypothetical protein
MTAIQGRNPAASPRREQGLDAGVLLAYRAQLLDQLNAVDRELESLGATVRPPGSPSAGA